MYHSWIKNDICDTVLLIISPLPLLFTPDTIHFPHPSFSNPHLTHTDIITLTLILPSPHTPSLPPRDSGTPSSPSHSLSLSICVIPPHTGNRYDMFESVRTLRHSTIHNGLPAETNGEEQDLGSDTLRSGVHACPLCYAILTWLDSTRLDLTRLNLTWLALPCLALPCLAMPQSNGTISYVSPYSSRPAAFRRPFY